MKYTIYLDMDGVIVDFDGGIEQLGIGDVENNSAEWWEAITKAGVKFWLDLEWLKDGKKLYKYVKKFNPVILSAHSRDKATCIKGKKGWLKNNIGIKQANRSIICWAKQKKLYANENAILIDDRLANVKMWRAAGGIAIRHLNTKTTIARLKKIIKKAEVEMKSVTIEKSTIKRVLL